MNFRLSKVQFTAASAAVLGFVVLLWALRDPAPEVEAVDSIIAHAVKAPSSVLPTIEKRTPYIVSSLLDPSRHEAQQIEAIRGLPSELTAGEYAALFALLEQPCPDDFHPHRWYIVLNEIMETLRKPRFDRSGYASAMGALVLDREIDPIARDYAAQHLVLYLNSNDPNLNPAMLEDGVNALITVLDGERESWEPVSGTALMSLCDLHAKRGVACLGSHSEKLHKIITDHVGGSRPGMLSLRISAIQAAGRLHVPTALAAIRSFAGGNAGVEPSIRLSAIASLGYYAQEEDLPLLESIASGESNLRFAAVAALKNF